MSPVQFAVLAGLLAIALALLVWGLVQARRGAGDEPVLRRLAELESDLSQRFSQAHVDLAARVEQLKGDLRSDLADRLQQGLATVRSTVEQQLTDGRAELARNLTAATAADQARCEGFEAKTAQQLEALRGTVDAKLQGISDQVQQKLEKNIQEGFAHFQKVQEHLKAAEDQLRNVGAVGQSINELNSLLKLPHLRGRFGEAELGRLLADFLPAAAFEEQAVIVPGSRERVDAVVKFPHYRLPIDSKFNREQILPLFDTSDPARLEEARQQLAAAVRQQARDIATKYIHPGHGTTDLALMFLPSETIYFEVIRNQDLCEALHREKVFPVSPNTLAITLKSVAMSFSYYEFAENVKATLDQIRQAQASFGHFQKKFEDVGRNLEKAQQAYGTATGHLNRYSHRVVRLTGEAAPEVEAGDGG